MQAPVSSVCDAVTDWSGKYLGAAVRLDPSLADSHLLLGSLAEMEGDPGQAAVHYRHAIKAQPSFAAAYLSWGVVELSQRRLSESKAALSEAVRLRPDLLEAHLLLGNILAGEGNQPEARAQLRKAAASQDQAVRQAALEALSVLGPG